MINTIPDFCWALLNAYLTSEYDVMLWFKYSLDDTPVGLNGGDGGVLGVRVADVRVGDLCLVNEQLDWCVYSRIQWWRCFAHDLTHGPPVTKQNSEHTREVAESNRSHWQITLKQAHFSDFSGKKKCKAHPGMHFITYAISLLLWLCVFIFQPITLLLLPVFTHLCFSLCLVLSYTLSWYMTAHMSTTWQFYGTACWGAT